MSWISYLVGRFQASTDGWFWVSPEERPQKSTSQQRQLRGQMTAGNIQWEQREILLISAGSVRRPLVQAPPHI
jgi:hypothetical protein